MESARERGARETRRHNLAQKDAEPKMMLQAGPSASGVGAAQRRRNGDFASSSIEVDLGARFCEMEAACRFGREAMPLLHRADRLTDRHQSTKTRVELLEGTGFRVGAVSLWPAVPEPRLPQGSALSPRRWR